MPYWASRRLTTTSRGQPQAIRRDMTAVNLEIFLFACRIQESHQLSISIIVQFDHQILPLWLSQAGLKIRMLWWLLRSCLSSLHGGVRKLECSFLGFANAPRFDQPPSRSFPRRYRGLEEKLFWSTMTPVKTLLAGSDQAGVPL